MAWFWGANSHLPWAPIKSLVPTAYFWLGSDLGWDNKKWPRPKPRTLFLKYILIVIARRYLHASAAKGLRILSHFQRLLVTFCHSPKVLGSADWNECAAWTCNPMQHGACCCVWNCYIMQHHEHIFFSRKLSISLLVWLHVRETSIRNVFMSSSSKLSGQVWALPVSVTGVCVYFDYNRMVTLES